MVENSCGRHTPRQSIHSAVRKTVVVLALTCAVDLTCAVHADEPVVPKIVDGETQVVDGFKDPEKWIWHDLFVETEFDSDGDGQRDRMHVAVTRPQQTETEDLKVHVIYCTSPYYAGTAGNERNYFWKIDQEVNAVPPERTPAEKFAPKVERPVISKRHVNDWVPHGYAVVHSCSPGTGLSQGCPTIGGDNESLAPKAVVDWLNGRAKGFTELDSNAEVVADWATGVVGMTGTSFNGTLALAAATTGVDGLKAIIPVAPNTSYYHYYRSHGLVRAPFTYQGEDIDVLYDLVHSNDTAQWEICNCNVRDKEMEPGLDRTKGDYNDFWAGRDYIHDLKPVQAAVLMSHAFNDWNVMPEHSVRIYQALKQNDIPLRGYFHQGGHGGPPPMKMMNRWFTRYLYCVENGIEQEPKVWIVREADEPDKPTGYAEYPHPNAQPVTFHLTAGAPQQGQLVLEKPSQQPHEKVVDNYSFSGESLAQAEWTEHRLIYLSPELKKPLHLSGTARIQVRMASSKPAVNLSVWLVSLPWNSHKEAKITDNIVTRGWADPQNAQSLTESEPLVPGQFYDLAFDLQPDDQIIAAGQQIALMIFSSDREFTVHPKPGTELTIDLNATQLTLPIVGGKDAFHAAITIEPQPDPETSP